MENLYEKKLLDTASKLDAMMEACGEITNIANELVRTHSDNCIRNLVHKISEISCGEVSKEIKQFARSLKEYLVQYCGYISVKKACKEGDKEIQDDRTLEELLDELNNLVGLDGVKEQVNNLIAYQNVQKKRKENGLFSSKNTMHMAFTGNPGTGKTTVARIVGHIYKNLGLLSKGHFVEVSRTDLIAGYQGQTALKVKDVINKARGGVLFIDEAYSITENDHSDSYGRECLTELTKALEDYRDDLVVIVAGYTKPMELFFNSNPGLKSRFNTFIEFGDYSATELKHILTHMCNNNDYSMSEELSVSVESFFEKQLMGKNENFANGRLARNIYDDLVMNHAKRVNLISEPTVDDLMVLTIDDFVE